MFFILALFGGRLPTEELDTLAVRAAISLRFEPETYGDKIPEWVDTVRAARGRWLAWRFGCRIAYILRAMQ